MSFLNMIKPPPLCPESTIEQFFILCTILALNLEMRKYVFSIYRLFKSRVKAVSALTLLPGYSINPACWRISNLEVFVKKHVGVCGGKNLKLFTIMSHPLLTEHTRKHCGSIGCLCGSESLPDEDIC